MYWNASYSYVIGSCGAKSPEGSEKEKGPVFGENSAAMEHTNNTF